MSFYKERKTENAIWSLPPAVLWLLVWKQDIEIHFSSVFNMLIFLKKLCLQFQVSNNNKILHSIRLDEYQGETDIFACVHDIQYSGPISLGTQSHFQFFAHAKWLKVPHSFLYPASKGLLLKSRRVYYNHYYVFLFFLSPAFQWKVPLKNEDKREFDFRKRRANKFYHSSIVLVRTVTSLVSFFFKYLSYRPREVSPLESEK